VFALSWGGFGCGIGSIGVVPVQHLSQVGYLEVDLPLLTLETFNGGVDYFSVQFWRHDTQLTSILSLWGLIR
jgi:aspartyl/asparaginyl-tRNA synthetase